MTGERRLEVVCCVALSDALVLNYLTPIGMHPSVSRIWVVRHRPAASGRIPGARYVPIPAVTRPGRWLRMAITCRRLAARPEVGAFVSFNPIPYGLISAAAAAGRRKPVHFGFIGADWYRYADSWRGGWLRPLLRRGSFFTATGPEMRREMIRRGFPADRTEVLPHGVDLSRFEIADPARARYTAVFVGQLIRRKRVDLILEAFAELTRDRPEARLCIVGDGPLRPGLEARARDLGLAAAVDFAGQVDDVRPYLASSRIVVIASDGEGFPFALVEGICSGLVPVSTPTGTISDVITDGVNGLLTPRGDAQALADRLRRLLSDNALYERLRTASLRTRQAFGFAAATAVWDGWLRRLGAAG